MSDSNPTRVLYAQYKRAFDEVMGDPFALEPIEGAYSQFKRRSAMRIAEVNDLGHGVVNPARPLVNDFFCDVENAVRDAIPDDEERQTFWETYLLDEPLLSQPERTRLELALGKKFIARRLVPVNRYFVVIRHKLPRG